MSRNLLRTGGNLEGCLDHNGLTTWILVGLRTGRVQIIGHAF
jgi:hypothetical protein